MEENEVLELLKSSKRQNNMVGVVRQIKRCSIRQIILS